MLFQTFPLWPCISVIHYCSNGLLTRGQCTKLSQFLCEKFLKLTFYVFPQIRCILSIFQVCFVKLSMESTCFAGITTEEQLVYLIVYEAMHDKSRPYFAWWTPHWNLVTVLTRELSLSLCVALSFLSPRYIRAWCNQWANFPIASSVFCAE